MCGAPYLLEVGIPCNFATADPKICGEAGAGGWGFSGCMTGCADANFELHDRYHIIVQVTPTDTGCTPQATCAESYKGATQLQANPVTSFMALAVLFLAMWK